MNTESLAIDGGTAIINQPLPPRHLFSSDEKEAAMALFDRSITSGNAFSYNGEEELNYGREFSAFMGGGFADGVNSGTNALYVALRALNPEPFSEIIVPPITDPGGIMPVPLMNCIPVVADAVPGAYNTGPEQIEALITPLTRAIVVAHIGGEPADMDGIMEVARRHGLPVVEDCSQSHGASLNGAKVGSFGDLAAFSTMSGKHHCTGAQGGVVFTKDQALYEQVRRVADRGKPFDRPAGSTNAIAGLNCNLDELSCAIGRVQLAKLPGIIARRQAAADQLRPVLQNLASIRIPPVLPGGSHVYWWWRLEVVTENIRCSKREYCAALAAEGVPLNPEYSAAMPQRMEWFVNRCVFGSSRLPWSSPEYKGDANRQFPCPNASEAILKQFNLEIRESWGETETGLLGQAFAKVDAAFRR